MTFRVAWGRGDGGRDVATVAELDAALDSIKVPAGSLPYSVGIVLPDDDELVPVTLEILVGHPDRSFAFHVGDDDAAWASEPGIEPMTGIMFNYGGEATELWPERSRVSVAGAREAAREFVASGGKRPSRLNWDAGHDD